MTTLVGFGLWIKGNYGIVEIEELTIKGGRRYGLHADRGMKMKVIMRGCTVEDCQWSGVEADGANHYANDADISCDDLQVVGCGMSGVCAQYRATITLSGQGTNIQGNVTKGDSSYYGLKAASQSNIHLVHPLTKEQISTHNGGGGNWGGVRNIKQVSK